MAVQLRGKNYRILFRHDGKQQAFPLGTVSAREAEAKSAQVDYLLLRLKQRLIELPPAWASSISSGTTASRRPPRLLPTPMPARYRIRPSGR